MFRYRFLGRKFMRRWVAALVMSVFAGLPATAQEGYFAQLLKMPGSLDSLAQEVGMQISGAKACRIEHRLPSADIATIVAAMRKVDSAGVDAGFLKGAMIVRGLGLRPGTAECRVVAQKVDEAARTYAKLAGAIRN
jgi:hypothetical protein